MTFDLVVVGVISHDTNIEVPFLPSPNSESFVSSITETHGGAGANVAALTAFYGARHVGFVGMIGDDHLGARLIIRMLEYGVDLRGIRVSRTAPSTRIFTVFQPSGERSYLVHVGAHSELSTAIVPSEYVEGTPLWYIAPCAPEVHRSFVEFLAVHNVRVAFNPGTVYMQQAPVGNLMGLLAKVHILFLNDHEATAYSGMKSLHDAASSFLAHGPELVVVTRSESGSMAYQRGIPSAVTREAIPSTIVSDIGAGDAFAAGFLTEYTRSRDVGLALRLGSAFGAFSVTQAEIRMTNPNPDAIKAFLP